MMQLMTYLRSVAGPQRRTGDARAYITIVPRCDPATGPSVLSHTGIVFIRVVLIR